MAVERDNATEGQGAVLELSTAVQYVPGVGPRRAELLERLGIVTAADLIKHLPHRWEHHAGQMPIGELPIGATATVRGEVTRCRFVPGRGVRAGGSRVVRNRFQISLEDARHCLDVVWFNAAYLRDEIHPGMELQITGKVALYDDHRQMVNPKWRNVTGAEGATTVVDGERYQPIYPTTEDLSSDQIARAVAGALPELGPQIEDHFDASYRHERNLPELAEAYRMMHAPTDEDEVKGARRRLAYDELLLLQVGIAMKRHYQRHEVHAPALRWSEAIDQHIRRRFPFELTAAQNQVVQELAADLQTTVPMNRLLQGDVGSGKTVVALYALLMAAAAGRQGALMAPTELLAEQHHLSICDMLNDSNVRIALVTGSQTRAERNGLLQQIERGDIDIVIGTHALLTESVQFADPAVVVVDEQHRFGVSQRATMRGKRSDRRTVPHYLVMTATPIPRTLSLTIFGDLDISTIRQLPPGRQPITTRVVGPQKADEVYGYVAERVRSGEQAYVVVPVVEESAQNLKDVRSHAKELAETHFANLHVATIHGRLKRQTREQIMHRFRNGRIDVLVATTVIEVGVDVPNASVMIVEHAERFGLAQLHQLRGRVGRGSRKSLCVFLAEPTTEEAGRRIEAIGSTTDGFEIAEADLLIRGMGELVGTRQHGLPPLRVAAIPDDMELLQMARRDAAKIVEADPRLTDPKRRLLRGRLFKQFGEALGMADVG